MRKSRKGHCNFTNCTLSISGTVKVKRFHLNSGRKHWGTLKLCEEHFWRFLYDMNTGKKKWVTYYHKEKEPSAIIIEYKDAENGIILLSPNENI